MLLAQALNLQFVKPFRPFFFIMVMGSGISSNILHSFPYEAHWLRICSYIMFGFTSSLFAVLQIVSVMNFIQFLRNECWSAYYTLYFKDLRHNVFWGTYPMGLATIINYIYLLASNELADTVHARRLIIAVYVLWWIDFAISLMTAWGISFIIWKKHYYKEEASSYGSNQARMMRENLQSVLLLPVIALVVASSSSGMFTMSSLFREAFNRNIQLMTLTVTALIWFQAILLVMFIISMYLWNLYVNKIPELKAIFTMFILIGPMGQGSLGCLLLSNNISIYITTCYPLVPTDSLDSRIVKLSVAWAFKVFGILISLSLIASGIFFTIMSFVSAASYFNTAASSGGGPKIHQFHIGWWAITFPLGTMALGTNEFFRQYNPYVPMGAFKVISCIYSVMCIGSTIWCLIGSLVLYFPQFIQKLSPIEEMSDLEKLV